MRTSWHARQDLTTLAGRALLVERLLAGERAENVWREMGVSRRTAFKWLKRYRDVVGHVTAVVF